jgi:tetratricopeptide (TPR) repeat protein
VLTITASALTIGAHAVIDFDLSLSALAIVLWTMFGFARGIGIYSAANLDEKKGKKYVPPSYPVIAAVSVFSAIIILLTGSLASSGNYTVQAGKNIQSKNLSQGIAMLQKAISYNPFNADNHSNLARIYQAQGKFDEAITEAGKAIALSKYSAPRYAELARFYFNGKKSSEDAISTAEKALSLAPFQVQWYEFLARAYYTIGYNEMASGNRDTAKQYFEKTIGVPDRIVAQMASLDETGKKLWRDAPMMTSTPAVKLNVGTAQYILGRWSEADKNLQAALKDDNSKGEASLWLAILRDKQGRSQEAQELLVQAQNMAPELAKGYDGLLKLEILR